MRRSIARCVPVGWAVIAFGALPAWSQQPSPDPQSPAAATPAAAATPPADGEPKEKRSDAERIVALERRIEETEKELVELRASQEEPQSEYTKAKSEFTDLDTQLEDRKQELKHLREADRTEQADALQSEVDDLRKTRDLAKERFDLAIQERATRQEKIATLETKLQQDREAIAALQAVPTTQPAAPTAAPAAPTVQPQEAATQPDPAPVPDAGQAPEPATEGAATREETPQEQAPAPPPAEPVKPPSAELLQAQEQAKSKQAEAQVADAEVRSINERIETLGKEIENERKLLETARKKAQNAREQQATWRDQVRKRMSEGAPQDEIRDLWEKVAQAEDRAAQDQTAVRKHMEGIDKLNAELLALQGEQIAALEAAERKQQEAQAAEKQVKRLENPFHPENLKRWILQHGPRLAGIAIGAFALLWITKAAEHRIVRLLVRTSDHGTRADRENRAKTLASVFRNAAYIAVIVGAILMALAEIEVNIAPLLGGAAVIGLAVAFGAQSLIKDYFYGFIILLENQYTLNDVIKIGDTAGLVERISLRITVLRDLSGVVHFVPHGEATRVSNLTHGWSRTVLDIGVSYNEDADRVMKVLGEIGKELYQDAEFRPLMLGEPEILGLDALGDSAIVIKLMVKTRPLQQWTIKREYLRRIKKRFDELGIEIPFPHRTVYHRWEAGQHPPGLDPAGTGRPTES